MIERIVRPDGSVRYLSSNGQVVMDQHGTPARMRGTCIDITDRVLAEREREHMGPRYRSLVEAAPEAILLVDGSDQRHRRQLRARTTCSAATRRARSSARPAAADPTGRASRAAASTTHRLVVDVSRTVVSPDDDEHARGRLPARRLEPAGR